MALFFIVSCLILLFKVVIQTIKALQKKEDVLANTYSPPDTRNGLRHHRGAISMPSSEIENPHRLASPYEFFIVQQSPGAYHLDGKYTVFGYVVEGMDVVDQINRVPIDKREWPKDNIRMKVSIIK